MKNFIKYIGIFLSILMFFSTNLMAAEQILPLPKPSVDENIKKEVAKKKIIYPQRKPVAKKIEDQKDEKEKNDLVEEIENEQTEEVAIYPKKKTISF